MLNLQSGGTVIITDGKKQDRYLILANVPGSYGSTKIHLKLHKANGKHLSISKENKKA